MRPMIGILLMCSGDATDKFSGNPPVRRQIVTISTNMEMCRSARRRHSRHLCVAEPFHCLVTDLTGEGRWPRRDGYEGAGLAAQHRELLARSLVSDYDSPAGQSSPSECLWDCCLGSSAAYGTCHLVATPWGDSRTGGCPVCWKSDLRGMGHIVRC